jgi:hypothetical protein
MSRSLPRRNKLHPVNEMFERAMLTAPRTIHGWSWIMHPNVYHLLRYGTRHSSCLWWRKFVDVR